jgi:NarL family two-component system response regulator LiaR
MLGEIGLKLLIVDDSKEMREEIRTIVAGVADEVYECSGGSEALTNYALHRPDLVLMDIVMEGIDGLEATKRLISVYPEAKIVIVTSYDDDYLREAARAAGALDYVLKDNLLEIRRVLIAETSESGGEDQG